MEKVGIVVIGAGVVGLAVGVRLAASRKDVYILEKEPSFGQGTSSRNSEVIHAGIYYPPGSLKAKTCIEGRELVYAFCKKHGVPHKRVGKLIIARNAGEEAELEKLFMNGLANGVSDLKLIRRGDIARIEPNIVAEAAIHSPSTGVLDSHAYMKALVSEFGSIGGCVAYNSTVRAIGKGGRGYVLEVASPGEGAIAIEAGVVVNCAGLDSDKVARLAGIKDDSYRIKYSKGDYFRVHHGKARYLNGLVYPVPTRGAGVLGIHATLDTGGGMKLGPDDRYVDAIDYDVDPRKAAKFFDSVKDYMPFLGPEDLAPDTSGIRPRLQGPGEGFRDFIIKEESDRGLPGLINLVGIESPGLTASLAIADMVAASFNF